MRLPWLLPAVQQVRTTGRRVQCQSHLRQIGLAAHNYHDTYRQLPDYRAGGLLYGLLPYCEQQVLYEQLSALMGNPPRTSPKYRDEDIGHLTVYHCPDDFLGAAPGSASYLINAGLLDPHQLLLGFVHQPFRPTRWSDVRDGLSTTAFVSEGYTLPGASPQLGGWSILMPSSVFPATSARLDLAGDRCIQESRSRSPDWSAGGTSGVIVYQGGYNHLLPPNSPRCLANQSPFDIGSPRSGHVGGVYVLFGDSSVKFVSVSIDRHAWRATGSISDGDITTGNL